MAKIEKYKSRTVKGKSPKSVPQHLLTYVTRPESENYAQLNKALFRVASVGVNTMDRNELKQVAVPIIREARARIRQLENAGLTDSPAYRYIKNLNIKVSAAGKDTNTIKHNVMEAFNFLHSKTSTVSGASEYNTWLEEHLGATTTVEQRESIWDVVHRFENEIPQRFMQYGYDEMIKRISAITRASGFDVDRAYAAFTNILKSEENDILKYDPDEVRRKTPWMRGGAFEKD